MYKIISSLVSTLHVGLMCNEINIPFAGRVYVLLLKVDVSLYSKLQRLVFLRLVATVQSIVSDDKASSIAYKLKNLSLRKNGSIYVPGKRPTYPSPNLTFCPK